MGLLSGKVALITGGASGLGEADARCFVAEGAMVIIADVDDVRGKALSDELGAEFNLLDVRSESGFRGVVENLMTRHGRLDVLVNNAGVARPGTPETITEEDHRLVMSVCLDGTIFGCKYAIPAMVASGGGSIINISSIASIRGIPYAAGYSAAKGAVEAYTRAVAVYCKIKNLKIRCNSVHPGGFATPMIGKVSADIDVVDSASGAQFRKGVPRRLGDPADVGRLVLFLASDESSWINGQRFVIDNGDTITLPT